MSYVALYRKFRPRTFDEVRGQEHVTKTLRNQVKTGRLQHAYLFCGTRGTGKTSVAKILARAVNCENPNDGNPCGDCGNCRRIEEALSMNVIEIDAASNNGVDNIRDIIEEVQYRPTEGNYKVYIIDEVHMLSAGAFNALLKTLEEPPSYVIFILATTEAGRIPVTILSRCQRYDFRRIGAQTIADRMRELLDIEGTGAEDGALRFIARAADGSLRDALSLLDRCLAYYPGETLTYEKVLGALGEADSSVFASVTEAVIRGDAGEAVRIFGRQVMQGAEITGFVTDYMRFLRNLMIAVSSGEEDAAELIDGTREEIRTLQEIAGSIDQETVMRFIRILSDLLNRMRYAPNRRILAETTLIMMAKPESDTHGDAVFQRMRDLERRLREMEDALASGAYAPAGGYQAASPYVGNVPPGGNDAAAPEDKGEPLPDAAPEDLKKICEDWLRIIQSLKPSLMKQQLTENAHPQYNAETLENRLYVEFSGGMQETAAEVVLNDMWRQEFEDHIRKLTRRNIDVEFHLSKSRPQNVRNVDVEKMINEGIRMTVETDDSEDEEI